LHECANTCTIGDVLKDLAAAIENLDVPVDRDSLVEAIALRDRLDARITEAVGEFEANGWCAVDASASMTAWLRAHALMTRRSAQRAPLWNALVIRDEHCRFPGCDRPSTWCEGHHVVWVTQNGPTELANLALVCSRHHHVLHQPGWHAKLRPDGTFEVTDPNGQVRCTSPPRAEMPW
jgi:hypothetical protein